MGSAKVLDVYQLLMYWDGLVEEGQSPYEGILIAEEIPTNVVKSIAHINSKKDKQGNDYNFSWKKPQNYGIE